MASRKTDRQEARQSNSPTTDTSFEVEELELDPTRRGYTQVPNYFAYYWTPLLGAKAALTYERICSFAHGKKNDCYPSIGLLADILAIDRHDLTGRIRRDRRQGRQREYYQKGVLQHLADSHLVRVAAEERNGGVHYKFQVLKYPPLLTEAQVAQLPVRLQRKHQELLDRCRQEREDFTHPPQSKVWPPEPTQIPSILTELAQGGDGVTGGGVTASQGGSDGVTPHLNTQGTKQLNTLSPPPSPDAVAAEEGVKTFYQQIGQSQVSRQKIKAGVKTVADLKSQGFKLVDILWVMMWITTHQEQFGGEVYSLGLLPQVIGQALKVRETEEKRHAKHTQQSREDHQLQAEIKRRQELQHLYQTLAPTEQAALREVAVEGLLKNGFKKQFLLESLVQGEVCRLLSEGHKDSALSCASQ